MGGSDFLHLAVRLSGGATEAQWRSAVSRAYYGAFHLARDFVGTGNILSADLAQLQSQRSDLRTLHFCSLLPFGQSLQRGEQNRVLRVLVAEGEKRISPIIDSGRRLW